MNKNRQKGIRYELKVIHDFKDMNFSQTKSTREGSRFLDGKKIDIMDIPFHIQVKSGKKHVNPFILLLEIENNVKQFNLDETKPVLLVRFHDIQKGKNRTFETALVFMYLSQFEKCFNKVLEINFSDIVYTNKQVSYQKILSNFDTIIIKKDIINNRTMYVFSYYKFLKMVKKNENI